MSPSCILQTLMFRRSNVNSPHLSKLPNKPRRFRGFFDPAEQFDKASLTVPFENLSAANRICRSLSGFASLAEFPVLSRESLLSEARGSLGGTHVTGAMDRPTEFRPGNVQVFYGSNLSGKAAPSGRTSAVRLRDGRPWGPSP